jgi:ubiquinone/menaquinone biosynthesis C-methylase UbiE
MMDDLELSTNVASSREQISPHRGDHDYESGDCGFDYETKLWGGHKVGLSPRYLGAMRLRYCLEDLRDVRGKVLEIGCGAGGMTRAIKSHLPDLDVSGCDISLQAIKAARRSPGGVHFKVADAYDLPYCSNSLSAVVMFDVLEHLDNPERCIAEVWRVLEGGGLFHFYVPCEGEIHSLHGLLARLGWRAKEQYGGHIQNFRTKDVISILNNQYFHVRRHRWSAHLINQTIDVAYFIGLSLRGKNTSMSVEGYLEVAKPSLITIGINALKTVVAVASYYESRLFRWLPGGGGHFSALKVSQVMLRDIS